MSVWGEECVRMRREISTCVYVGMCMHVCEGGVHTCLHMCVHGCAHVCACTHLCLCMHTSVHEDVCA